jgi:hypothetical protein
VIETFPGRHHFMLVDYQMTVVTLAQLMATLAVQMMVVTLAQLMATLAVQMTVVTLVQRLFTQVMMNMVPIS